ncbi:MAG: tryptophan-rich sensory protein [Anaerolineae bacterium]|nr:tryptophan-rich sensory protein [Anaerolineae bacterium]
MSNQLRQIINVVAILVTITVNTLANTLPINGQTTAQVSDKFPVPFVPAGYVFAIWGIIYLGMLLFAVYQALPSQRDNPRLRSLDLPFVVNNVANSVWIFFWHYELFTLTEVAMLVVLGTLIMIYLRLGVGQRAVSQAERWLVQVPFRVYLGWITVATIANTQNWLYSLGWRGAPLTSEVWAVVLLLAALAVSAILGLTRGDIAYLLVIVWATVGIWVKQTAFPLAANTALVTAILVGLIALYTLFRPRPGSPLPAPAQ